MIKSVIPSRLADDPYLHPFLDKIRERRDRADKMRKQLAGNSGSLADFASGHEYFGLHKTTNGWVFREWAPNAEAITLIGEFSHWQESSEYALSRIDNGVWELYLPEDALQHGELYKLKIHWHGGSGERIPVYARRVVQDTNTKIFNAQVWNPSESYVWQNSSYKRESVPPLIYEAHIGMAQEHGGVGTYDEFRIDILPRIIDAGYNTIQFMAIQEHPYYGSFGYHVAN